jgi:hypothetical protein
MPSRQFSTRPPGLGAIALIGISIVVAAGALQSAVLTPLASRREKPTHPPKPKKETATPTRTPTPIATPTATPTSTGTPTPILTPTPTGTPTPAVTLTPTPDSGARCGDGVIQMSDGEICEINQTLGCQSITIPDADRRDLVLIGRTYTSGIATCCTTGTCDTDGDGFAEDSVPLCEAFDLSGCAYCGNGQREGGEQCDGTDLTGGTCAALMPCPFPASSGDPRSCDDATGVVTCSESCSYLTSDCQRCGDGIRTGSEECDRSAFASNLDTCQEQTPDWEAGTPGCNTPDDDSPVNVSSCTNLCNGACNAPTECTKWESNGCLVPDCHSALTSACCGDGICEPALGECCTCNATGQDCFGEFDSGEACFGVFCL